MTAVIPASRTWGQEDGQLGSIFSYRNKFEAELPQSETFRAGAWQIWRSLPQTSVFSASDSRPVILCGPPHPAPAKGPEVPRDRGSMREAWKLDPQKRVLREETSFVAEPR